MKAKTKISTRSASKAHKGKKAADTKKLKKFEVGLSWAQHNDAKVIIEAASLAEAEKMADEIQSEEVDDWEPVGGELWVDYVEPVEGGQDDELRLSQNR